MKKRTFVDQSAIRYCSIHNPQSAIRNPLLFNPQSAILRSAIVCLMLWCCLFSLVLRPANAQTTGSPELQAIVDDSVSAGLKKFASAGIKENQLAVTLLDLTEPGLVRSASFRGSTAFYPASVVKLFYLVAAHTQAAKGHLTIDEELGRALTDMIVDSSNDATGYVVDRLTGTTSGPELTGEAWQQWIEKRQAINQYFRALGYENINVCQKTFGDDAYGREQQFRGKNEENSNSLTTDSVARLWFEIVSGHGISPEARTCMMSLLARNQTIASDDPDDQATKYIGRALPPTARLWSKAGWTGEVRHDSAYIELPNGARCILVIFTSGCSKQPELIPTIAQSIVDKMLTWRPKADAILVNGNIWTGTGKTASALAMRDGRIIAVGTDGEVRALADQQTKIIDLEGKPAVPGFIESHSHIINGGFDLLSIDLRYAKTSEEFAAQLGDYTARRPAGEWILGGNWDHERWPGAPLPTRQLIDSATPNNPVFVRRLDGHMALANSRALALAGITRETPDPSGGQIVRDDKGEPTGILKDEAMELVYSKIPPPSDAQYDAAFAAALEHAARYGVTALNDMGSSWADYRAYWRAHRAGKLTARVNMYTPIMNWREHLKTRRIEGRGDDWLQLSGLKGYADGSLGSTTALFFDPYLDSPNTKGLMMTELSDGRLRNAILGADAAGLQVAIHAIGDRANHLILDLYAEVARINGARDRRLRIEHAQHLRPEDIPRFGALGVVASMQPYHCIDDGRWAEKRIGYNRCRTTYAFRSLLEQKATLAFGSDWPVAPLNPLAGIYAAVTRRTLDDKNPNGWVPEEKIDVAAALRGYTSGAAYGSFQERVKGSLEAGKFADIAVLNENIFNIAPERLADVTVRMTIVGGRIVYQGK